MNLVVLCDSYPLRNGEFFLDDEMDTLSSYFKKIYLFCIGDDQVLDKRSTPDNMVVIPLNLKLTMAGIIALTPSILPNLNILLGELINVKKVFEISVSSKIVKIATKELLLAISLKARLKKEIKRLGLLDTETVFYSYWHDYKALALALMKHKGGVKAVSRAHGWDVDYQRHSPPYLPFKKKILSSLDFTFCISTFGKKTFSQLLDGRYDSKVFEARLGKINDRHPIKDQNGNSITICSCSSLIPLKRVHLIAELVAGLGSNAQWVHFGDGPLRGSLEENIRTNFPNLKYKIMGNVSNASILDYYTSHYIDLFINASETEGIPVSIMEAQSAGIPVLATNVGGTSEIVNQENGFLIDKDFEIEMVVTLISSYLNSPKDVKLDKRIASYQNWKEYYNAEKNYKEFAESLLLL